MSANGISHHPLKRTRQQNKLDMTIGKREGRTVALDGTISGAIDSSAPAFRTKNALDIQRLPTLYHSSSNTGALTDNPNPAGLVLSRPWV